MNKIILVLASFIFLSGCSEEKLCVFTDENINTIKQECTSKSAGYCSGLGCSELSGACVFNDTSVKNDAKCSDKRNKSDCDKKIGNHKLCEWK